MTVADKPVNVVSGTRALNVSGSHQVAVLVEVLIASRPGTKVLREVIDGTVSLDASAEARGRVSLMLPATEELVPTSPWSLLAPFGNEIRVSRGVEYGDRIDLVQLGIFRIDSCSVSGNTISLDGLDRAATFIDAAFEAPGEYPAGTRITDIIMDILIGGATFGFQSEFVDRAEFEAVTPQTVYYEEGEDRWGKAQEAAVALGGELYFDSRGVLVLRPVPLDTGDADVGSYEEGPGGVLLNAGRSFDRTTVTNRVIVSGENSDPAAIPRGVATDVNPASPTYYYGPFGHKPMFTTSTYVTDLAMANDMATGILIRSMGAPDSIEFEAIVNPGLRPSDTVWIKRELLALNERHVIDSVDIPLSATAAMSCRTRAVELFTA